MATRRPPGAMPLDEAPWPARDAAPQRPRPPGALPLDPLPRPVPASALGRRPTDPSLNVDELADEPEGDTPWDELGPTESFTPPPLTTPATTDWDELGPTESLALPVSSTTEASTSAARPTPTAGPAPGARSPKDQPAGAEAMERPERPDTFEKPRS